MLTGLPKNLGAFDVFIGEEEYLKRWIGAQAIVKFFVEFAGEYSHIFADPAQDNFAAIKTYQKAGFKVISEQSDIGEIWMLYEVIHQ